MSTGNLGDLRVGLVLDVNAFNQGLQTAQTLARMFSKNVEDILKLKPPTFKSAEFNLEINKLDSSLKKYEQELQKTTAAEKQAETSKQQLGAATIKLDDVFSNIGLRVQGFRSILTLLQSTFGDLIHDYEAQEIAISKLENGLRNVGESSNSLNKLTAQASELQNITPFGDEEINNAQAMLTTFQKSSEQIEILTPRMLDLAAAYMKQGDASMDLQQVAVMLGKVNEDTIGGLKRVGVAFTEKQEKELKAATGTKQTILLAEILDQNFKGMAVTVGQTTAGQMAIFKNKIGEVKEALGQILSNGLVPLLTPLGSFFTWIQNAPPAVQRLTIVVIALSAAFITLNTSLGGLPYIIGSVAGLLYTLSGNMSNVEKDVEAANEEFLKSKEVTADMKKILDETGISANNMSEAYNNLGDAILSMTNKQLISAKQFVEAEIAKQEAIASTAATTWLQSMPDYVPPDWGKSIENTTKMVVEPELNKLKGLLDQINTKMKYTPPDATKTSTSTSTTKEDDAQNKEQEALSEFLEGQNKKIEALDFEIEMGRKVKASKLELLGILSEELNTYSQSLEYAANKAAAEEKVTGYVREHQRITRQLGEETLKIIDEAGKRTKELADEKAKDEKTAAELIKKYNLELTDDEYDAEMQKIDDEYDAEVDKINKLKIDELAKINLVNKAKQSKEKKEQDVEVKKITKEYDKQVSDMQAMVNLAGALKGKLGEAGDSFLGYLQTALQVMMQIMQLQGKEASGGEIGAGDILSLFTTIIGGLAFLSSGGEVTGSGSGDTVPAMLTPGEVVVSAPRVKQLTSEHGSNIIQYLLGRTSILPLVSGRYSTGGLVTASVAGKSGSINVTLNGKPLDSAMKRKIASEGIYLENLQVDRNTL